MKRNLRILIGIFFALVSVFYRFIPFKLPNIEFFSTLIAFTILSSDKKLNLLWIPLLVLLSDILLNVLLKVPFDPKWETIVLIGWILVICVQYFLRGKKFYHVATMELFGTLVFYFITNSLVFFVFDFYPKNISGYIACMIAGIPFLKNQAIFNILFSPIVFLTVNELGFGNIASKNSVIYENS